MIRNIIGKIFKAIPITLVIVSFGASIYAANQNIGGVTYATSVVLGVMVALYFLGMLLDRKTKGKEVIQAKDIAELTEEE